MAKCCVEAEACIQYRRIFGDIKTMTPLPIQTAEAVAAACVSATLDLPIGLIIILTDSGKLARLVSKYRPKVKILACSINASVVRQLNVMRGCIGFKIPTFQGTESVIQLIISVAKKMNLTSAGSQVAVIHGTNEDTPDESNIFKILDLSE
jgi:pyruvate kinase